MPKQQFVLTFPDIEKDEAGKYAASLAKSLGDLNEDEAIITVQRDNPEAQDFGATVVLILGTSAATAIASGIREWLIRNAGAELEIHKDGTVIAKKLRSKDAASIANSLSSLTK